MQMDHYHKIKLHYRTTGKWNIKCFQADFFPVFVALVGVVDDTLITCFVRLDVSNELTSVVVL